MVQNLLLATILDGDQDLSSHLLLLEDQFLSLVQISFTIFRVVGSWEDVGGFNRLDSDSVLLVQDLVLRHESSSCMEGDCVVVPLKQSLSPSGMGSFEGVRCLEKSTFMGCLSKDLSIRNAVIRLGILVQNVQGTH